MILMSQIMNNQTYKINYIINPI